MVEVVGPKLKFSDELEFSSHRSGWPYALDAIKELDCPSGILFDDFVDSSHSYHLKENIEDSVVPYREPWIGVIHNPHNMPQWYDYCNSPNIFLKRDAMRESMKQCKGLFTLSEYFAEWLRKEVYCPVSSLIHPTMPCDKKFTMDLFCNNPDPKIFQIGFWLRSTVAIQMLPTCKYEKVWIRPVNYAPDYRDREMRTIDTHDKLVGNYREKSWVDHKYYDELLCKNLVFINLLDASANNAIIECIVRHTPILVNRHPAAKEYLGGDYPFFYDNLKEAAAFAEDHGRITAAYMYLRDMDKEKFTQEYFYKSFINSEVYQSL